MTEIIVAQRMWQRRDTAANWAAVNPVLADGEIGVQKAGGGLPVLIKVGNGVDAWTALPYYGVGQLADPGQDKIVFWDDTLNAYAFLSLGTGLSINAGSLGVVGQGAQTDGLALSDLSTSLVVSATTGYWVVPVNCVLLEVFTALVVAPSSSGPVTVDAKLSGVSIFTTLPSIDATENTSLTGTQAVLAAPATFNKGDILVFSVTAAGAGSKGLQARIRYRPT